MSDAHPLRQGMQWRLKSGDTNLGVLRFSAVDQPWFRCEFSPAESWSDFRRLFERQAEAVDKGTPDEVSAAFKQVQDLRLRLIPETAEEWEIEPTLVQIRGNSAFFRY